MIESSASYRGGRSEQLFRPKLTPGYLARHAPSKSAQDREAALSDVVQGLLLCELAEVGVLSTLAFKGGTALRKVYAGASGRFSTDLDFAVRNLADDPSTVSGLIQADPISRPGFRFTRSSSGRAARRRDSGTHDPPHGA